MSEPSRAVFLSYASQDGKVARRICEALGAGGIEVWFDQSELRGGDAWDRKIAKQIRECALFIAVISAHTNARAEGYFRREWRIAAERTRDMADDEPFLLPVVIDETPDGTARVPDKFREVHWTALPAGDTPPAFVERVLRLLSPAATVQSASPTPSTIPEKSIAVLPFASLSDDPEKGHFGDGIAEELIHLLARVPGLKVPARTSSFAYKGRNVDARRIARDLHVSMLLEGSVRSAGERIRVSAQLIQAESGFHVWSQTYDRQFADVFTLQDELAGAIVQALKINVGDESLRDAPPTKDVEAYRLYLQARAIFAMQGVGSVAAIERMLEILQRSIARDPGFARAHAFLGLLQVGQFQLGFRGPEILLDAQRSVERALTLDPDMAEAHFLRAAQRAVRGQWLVAASSYCRAIALNPGEASIRVGFATQVLGPVGKLQQALEKSREAYRLAPASISNALAVAAFSLIAGRDGEAEEYIRIALDLGHPEQQTPLPMFRSDLARRAGKYGEAAAHTSAAIPAKIRAQGGDDVIGLVFAGLADARQAPEAVAALRALNKKGEPPILEAAPMLAHAITWYAMLGAFDDAYETAGRIVSTFARTGVVNPLALWAIWLPELRPFRQDPRFGDFSVGLGLIDYWREQGPPDSCELRDGRLIVP